MVPDRYRFGTANAAHFADLAPLPHRNRLPAIADSSRKLADNLAPSLSRIESRRATEEYRIGPGSVPLRYRLRLRESTCRVPDWYRSRPLEVGRGPQCRPREVLGPWLVNRCFIRRRSIREGSCDHGHRAREAEGARDDRPLPPASACGVPQRGPGKPIPADLADFALSSPCGE